MEQIKISTLKAAISIYKQLSRCFLKPQSSWTAWVFTRNLLSWQPLQVLLRRYPLAHSKGISHFLYKVALGICVTLNWNAFNRVFLWDFLPSLITTVCSHWGLSFVPCPRSLVLSQAQALATHLDLQVKQLHALTEVSTCKRPNYQGDQETTQDGSHFQGSLGFKDGENKHHSCHCTSDTQNCLLLKSYPSGSVAKYPPTNAGDLGSIAGSGRSPRGGNGKPNFSILAWEIPWTEKPGGLGVIKKSDTT